MVVAQLGRLLKKIRGRIFLPGEGAEEKTPLPKLLAKMDAYDWESIEDMPVNESEKKERLRYLKNIIGAAGVELDGSLLDLASGTASLAYLYPDAVAIDNDPRKTKVLRSDGIKAVIGDIESLPFEDKSFDYVVSFSPPQKPVVLQTDGCCHFHVDQECNRKLVDDALRIARKKALIASHAIAIKPPYEYLIEKRETNGYYFVLYKANSDPA